MSRRKSMRLHLRQKCGYVVTKLRIDFLFRPLSYKKLRFSGKKSEIAAGIQYIYKNARGD